MVPFLAQVAINKGFIKVPTAVIPQTHDMYYESVFTLYFELNGMKIRKFYCWESLFEIVHTFPNKFHQISNFALKHCLYVFSC